MPSVTSSDSLVSGAQGRQWENLAPLQVHTGQELPQQRPPQQTKEEKKKCHGNRKLQRFRRRCRARGFDVATIAQLTNDREIIDTSSMDTTAAGLPVEVLMRDHCRLTFSSVH